MFCRLLAQTTLRNILGTKNLHEILSDRESISSSMQVVFLYVLVQKVVGQFATNIVKQTTFWMMETLTFDTQWTILNYREVYWYSWMWHLWSQYLILICDRKCWTRRLSPGASKLNAWRCRLLHLIDWLFVAFKLKWYIARSIKT